MEDMTRPDQAKDSPIGKVESKTAELKTIAKDILELSMGVESFLLGATPMAKSEKADKKSPAGWLELLCDNLDSIKDTLGLAINCLRAVKSISK